MARQQDEWYVEGSDGVRLFGSTQLDHALKWIAWADYDMRRRSGGRDWPHLAKHTRGGFLLRRVRVRVTEIREGV